MDKLDIFDLASLLKVYDNNKLKDKELSTSLLPNAKVEKPFSAASDRLNFLIGAFADFKIAIFNSADDVDENQLLSTKEDALIEFKDDKAWLKYSAVGGVKASGGGSVEMLGLSIDKESSLILNTYRVHSPEETVKEAVMADLSEFVTIASKKGILEKLQPQEAVSFHVRAKLETNVSLQWSDIFASSLSQLGKLLDAGETFKIEVGASASVGFKVAIEDFFEVAILKIDDNSYEVNVKKAAAKAINLPIEAKVGVSFADSDAVDKALNNVLEGLIKQGNTKIQELIEKLESGKSLDDVKEILIIVAERLGINLDSEKSKLLETLKSLREKVKNTISEIAKSKVAFGFAFEYNRIRQESSFFKAIFNRVALDKYHTDLVLFNLKDILNDLRESKATGIELKKYLHSTVIKNKKAWGFGFSVGKWFSFAGKDFKEDELTVSVNNELMPKVSFVGTRMYESHWGKNKAKFGASFKAQMNGFSSSQKALLQEFDYGLHLILHNTERKVEREELKNWIDQAILWQAVNPGEAETLYQDLKKLENKENVEFTTQILLQHDTFVKILPYLAEGQQSWWAHAFAASMPYMEDFDIRRSVMLRRIHYAPLWLAYLQNPAIGYQEWANVAKKELWKDNKNLAHFEGRLTSNQVAGEMLAFAGLIRVNSNTAQQLQTLQAGFQLLYEKHRLNQAYDPSLMKAFSMMQTFWTQSQHISTFGRYLIELSQMIPATENMERIFTIVYKEGEEEKTINISQS